jgi:hypothetical protein
MRDYYENIHTKNIYLVYTEDVIEISPTRKRTMKRGVLFGQKIKGEMIDIPQVPFRLNDDWNKFNTFKKIDYEEIVRV